MKKDVKKALYESIMSSVAKEVKKALNEAYYHDVKNAIDEIIDEDKIDTDDFKNHSVADVFFILYPELGEKLAKKLNTNIDEARWYVSSHEAFAEDLSIDYCGQSDLEYITYNDIIDAVEGEDYQEIIDNEGEGIADWILDRIMYPENGYNCASACVEIAQRLLDGESADDLREELGEDAI